MVDYDKWSASWSDWDWQEHTLRRETGLVEHLCPHGVGHPNPGSIIWMEDHGPEGARGSWGVHGCDGCCGHPSFPDLEAALRHAHGIIDMQNDYIHQELGG